MRKNRLPPSPPTTPTHTHTHNEINKHTHTHTHRVRFNNIINNAYLVCLPVLRHHVAPLRVDISAWLWCVVNRWIRLVVRAPTTSQYSIPRAGSCTHRERHPIGVRLNSGQVLSSLTHSELRVCRPQPVCPRACVCRGASLSRLLSVCVLCRHQAERIADRFLVSSGMSRGTTPISLWVCRVALAVWGCPGAGPRDAAHRNRNYDRSRGWLGRVLFVVCRLFQMLSFDVNGLENSASGMLSLALSLSLWRWY